MYSQLFNHKNKLIHEETYVKIVELCLRNGNLNQSSYFLCQMDKNKIPIPRNILDMFLDSSVMTKNFEKHSEKHSINSKSDNAKGSNKGSKLNNGYYDPDYYYYQNSNKNFNQVNENEEKNKLVLNKEAKPFIPKNSNENINLENLSQSNKITLNPYAKMFIPKEKTIKS